MSSKTCSLRRIRRTDSKRTLIYRLRSLKSSPSWLRLALIKYLSSSLALARLLTKTRVWFPRQRSAMKVSFQSICRRSECPLFAQVQKYTCQNRSLKLSLVLLAENNRLAKLLCSSQKSSDNLDRVIKPKLTQTAK